MESAGEISTATGGEGAGLGYVVALESATARVPASAFADHAGLRAVQTVKSGADRFMHILFWATPQHHELGTAFLRTSLQARTVFEGTAARLAAAPAPWYKRVKPSTFLLSTVAVLGALETLSNRYEKLFVAPSAAVKLDRDEYRLTQGEPLAARVSVENLLGVADLRDVEVSAAVEAGGKSHPVRLGDEYRPSIPPGKDRAFQLTRSGLAPGDYELKVQVLALGGYLRWTAAPFIQSAAVRVFPITPRGSVSVRAQTPTRAELVAVVPTGSPLAATASCEISFAPGPRFEYRPLYTADEAVFESRIGADRKMRAVLAWRPGIVAAKTDFQRLVTVVADQPVDWARVAPSAKVECSRE